MQSTTSIKHHIH